MSMADVVEVDALTGAVSERDFTDVEAAQRAADAEAARQADKEAEADAQSKEDTRLAALDKLLALGLTVDDLYALGL